MSLVLRLRNKALVVVVSVILLFSSSSAILFYSEQSPQSGFNGAIRFGGEVTFTIHHSDQSLHTNLVYNGFAASGCDTTINPTSLWSTQGLTWSLSGVPKCSQGWTYTEDPSVTFMNQGTDWMQTKLFGIPNSITGNVGRLNATVLGVSASSNAISQTDTYAGTTGPCNSGTIWNGGDGFNAVRVTNVAGAPSAGSATNTASNTFTDVTANVGTINAACVLINLIGTSPNYIFCAVTFGPDTFAVNDQLTTSYTWTVSG